MQRQPTDRGLQDLELRQSVSVAMATRWVAIFLSKCISPLVLFLVKYNLQLIKIKMKLYLSCISNFIPIK